MTSSPGSLRHWIRAPFLSSRWLLSRAALILVCLGVFHLLGWRDNVSFLSGTPSDDEQSRLFAVASGVTYALVYFAAVVGVPILVIAAVLLSGMNCVIRKTRTEA